MTDDKLRNEGVASEDVNLDSSQLKGISGGASDKKPPEDVYCGACGSKMEFRGWVPNSYRTIHYCPKCDFTSDDVYFYREV